MRSREVRRVSKAFYAKLAAANMKKNARVYLPFLITCVITVMMFYIICSLALGTGKSEDLPFSSAYALMEMGTIIVGIFAAIFLFYTNSFLMKRRRKEFGLYNILGMEKKHLARVVFYETFYTALLSLAAGILLGVFFGGLCELLLQKALGMEADLQLFVNIGAMYITIIVMCIIFLLILLSSVRHIVVSKPIELLRGGEKGEKEPKTRWLLALLGVISLGCGYYLAVTTKDPMRALSLFFLAVILVIIGTYLLFGAISIAVLKMMRNNKRYFYKQQHFISVSGMIYRMKQNAVGLANICILSTMVIVMVSISLSLYLGIDSSAELAYPREVAVTAYGIPNDALQEVREDTAAIVQKTAKENGYKFENAISMAVYDDVVVIGEDGTGYNKASEKAQSAISKFGNNAERQQNVTIISAKDYTEITGQEVEVGEGEIVADMMGGQEVRFSDLELGGVKYAVRVEKGVANKAMGVIVSTSWDEVLLVVRDGEAFHDVVEAIDQEYSEYSGEAGVTSGIRYRMFFDPESSDLGSLENTLENTLLSSEWGNIEWRWHVDDRESMKESMKDVLGGLLFVGVFLSVLFAMAAVLIIYYKQISEGYDDKRRYEIMKQVGMDKSQIKKSIHSQILSVFFMPLITAGVHTMFAFPMVTTMIIALLGYQTMLFLKITIAVFLLFAALYAIVYALSAKSYYRITASKD